MRPNKKKLWKPIARLSITGLALFLILRTVEVSAVLSLFAHADFLYVGLAIGLSLLIRVLMAWKWKLLLHYCGTVLSLGYLLKISLVSSFLGAALPSSIGADIVRTISVGRLTGYTSAAVSTIADRIMAIVAMTLWSLTAALIALWADPALQRVLLPIVALCAGMVVILLMLLSDTAIRVVLWTLGSSRGTSRRERTDGLSGFRGLIRQVANKAVRVHQELRELLAKPPVFVAVFFLNVLFQGARIILFYLLFLAVGIHIAIVYHIVFVPVIMFVTLLPFSFLGIGIKEAAVVFFYTRVGVDPASAFTVSIWTYLVIIPPLAIGGLLYLLGRSSDFPEINKIVTKKFT